MNVDPGRLEGNCPVCGVGTSAKKGSPTPLHQRAGTRQTCPGAGSPAQ